MAFLPGLAEPRRVLRQRRRVWTDPRFPQCSRQVNLFFWPMIDGMIGFLFRLDFHSRLGYDRLRPMGRAVLFLVNQAAPEPSA